MNLDELLIKNQLVDVIRGRSFSKDLQLYVKHLDLFDQYDIDDVYYTTYSNYRDEEIPTEQDLIDFFEETGEWGQNKEEEIDELEEFVNELRANKSKYIHKEYIEEINKEINFNTAKLIELKNYKHRLFCNCCESLANKRLNEVYILKSFYKDKELEKPYFTKESMDELEDYEIARFIGHHNKVLGDFSENRIKQISVSDTFQYSFRICDSPESYFRKPMVELTFYQNILLSYGNIFKNIFMEHGADIPKDIRNDPDKILELVSQRNEVKKRSAGKDGNVQFVGMNSEDRERLGVGGVSYAQRFARDGFDKDKLAQSLSGSKK